MYYILKSQNLIIYLTIWQGIIKTNKFKLETYKCRRGCQINKNSNLISRHQISRGQLQVIIRK